MKLLPLFAAFTIVQVGLSLQQPKSKSVVGIRTKFESNRQRFATRGGALDDASPNGGNMLATVGQNVRDGWNERAMAAGSSRVFLIKALTEIGLAVTFQLLAEIQRRRGRFWPEFDYVLAGTITAVLGKGYSAWVTAPTVSNTLTTTAFDSKPSKSRTPTNVFAFGDYTLANRCFALVKPAPRLFFVGASSAFLGYGLAASLGSLRGVAGLAGSGVKGPPPVPLLGAALFTGTFLVTVSNLSYQIVQGLVELRMIDGFANFLRGDSDEGSFRTRVAAFVRWALFVACRASRGIIVSGLAIRGMQLSGLQKSSA
mmetsp:Transcript_68834/g.138393  ORF Transcript_68834/g.138393 Transcript_68834/m.138393 type:complete len:313 (-) Transcript_68834:325-1263(-)